MKKQIQILVILVLVILTGVIIYFRYLPKENKPNTPVVNKQSNTPKYKTFKSEVINISIQLPQDYLIEEKLTHVELKKGNNSIGLDRNAHAFRTLKEYLDDADEKDKLEFTRVINEFEINSFPAVIRDELRGGVKVRMYYIFTPDWVYIFSTDSESLYPDLDQIAKSFRYTP